MAGAVQATGQWLIDQLKKLRAEGEQRRAEIAMLNQHIVDEDKRAQQISDVSVRNSIRAKLHDMALAQGAAMNKWRTFWGNVEKLSAQAITWLRDHGYATTGLSGPELVPLAIVVALTAGATLWVVNTQLGNSYRLRTAQLDEQKKLDTALLSGQIVQAQYDAASKSLKDQVDAKDPSADPFGLANLSKALMPIALVALGFIVLPPLIDAFAHPAPRRRAA